MRKKERIFSYSIFVSLLLFIGASMTYAQVTTFYTYPSPAYVQEQLFMDTQLCNQREVTFTILTRSVPNKVGELGFEVIYDPFVLEYKAYERGDLTQDFDAFDVNPYVNGRLRITGTVASPIPVASSGTIAKITFSVRKCQNSELILANLTGNLAGWSVSNGYLIADYLIPGTEPLPSVSPYNISPYSGFSLSIPLLGWPFFSGPILQGAGGLLYGGNYGSESPGSSISGFIGGSSGSANNYGIGYSSNDWLRYGNAFLPGFISLPAGGFGFSSNPVGFSTVGYSGGFTGYPISGFSAFSPVGATSSSMGYSSGDKPSGSIYGITSLPGSISLPAGVSTAGYSSGSAGSGSASGGASTGPGSASTTGFSSGLSSRSVISGNGVLIASGFAAPSFSTPSFGTGRVAASSSSTSSGSGRATTYSSSTSSGGGNATSSSFTSSGSGGVAISSSSTSSGSGKVTTSSSSTSSTSSGSGGKSTLEVYDDPNAAGPGTADMITIKVLFIEGAGKVKIKVRQEGGGSSAMHEVVVNKDSVCQYVPFPYSKASSANTSNMLTVQAQFFSGAETSSASTILDLDSLNPDRTLIVMVDTTASSPISISKE